MTTATHSLNATAARTPKRAPKRTTRHDLPRMAGRERAVLALASAFVSTALMGSVVFGFAGESADVRLAATAVSSLISPA